MTFKDAQLKGYDITEKEYNILIKEINNAYDDAFKNITRELEKIYTKILGDIDPDDYRNEMIKYNRLDKLQKEIFKLYQQGAIKAGSIQKEASKLAISNLYYRDLFLTNYVAKEIYTVLSPAVIEVSVLGTNEIWKRITKTAQAKIEKSFGSLSKYQPQYGTLTDLLKGHRVDDLEKLRKTLLQAMIQGDSFSKTAKRIEGIADITKSNALRIARTEGIRNLNAGNYANTEYARSQGIKSTRVWDATLDMRTRQPHANLDGKPENKNGEWCIGGDCASNVGQFSDASNNIGCRCTIRNDIDGISPELRRARDPVTGRTDIIGFTSFNEWAKSNDLKYNKSGRLVPKI